MKQLNKTPEEKSDSLQVGIMKLHEQTIKPILKNWKSMVVSPAGNSQLTTYTYPNTLSQNGFL